MARLATKDWRARRTIAGTPVTWDPSEPIRYVLNPADAPAKSEQVLEQAIALVSGISGLDFIFEGLSDEPYSLNRDARSTDGSWAPVHLSWTDIPSPSSEYDVLGLTDVQARWIGAHRRYVSATVTLNSQRLRDLHTKDSGVEYLRAIIMHELGHLVGLGHVADERLLMNPVVVSVDPGAGDVAGLRAMGSLAHLP